MKVLEDILRGLCPGSFHGLCDGNQVQQMRNMLRWEVESWVRQ